jgi:hypothetical protein
MKTFRGKKVKKGKQLTVKYGNKTILKADAIMVEFNTNREVATLRRMNGDILETVPCKVFTFTLSAKCWGSVKK